MTAHHKPIPPTAWQRVKRVYSRALMHAALQLADGHSWTALALVTVAGLSAVPAEMLAAHSWLRLSLPILLATIGFATKTITNHGDVVARCK